MRVEHRATGATGTIVGRFTTDNPFIGNLNGKWVCVSWDDGETFSVPARAIRPVA